MALPTPSLQKRLVTACNGGDWDRVSTAVASGASVNEKGNSPRWSFTGLPLVAAVSRLHYNIVALLLYLGADPNGEEVMAAGAYHSTPQILQLLLDAGGGINQKSGGEPPIFTAIASTTGDVEGKVRVLLAQPALDLAAAHKGKTPMQWAQACGRPALAETIDREVRPIVGRVTAAPF